MKLKMNYLAQFLDQQLDHWADLHGQAQSDLNAGMRNAPGLTLAKAEVAIDVLKSVQEAANNDLTAHFYNKIEHLLREKAKAAGIKLSDDGLGVLEGRLECYTYPRDQYDHYFFVGDNGDRIRLLSVEHTPSLELCDNSIRIESKYY